jgi:hypothetical protein
MKTHVVTILTELLRSTKIGVERKVILGLFVPGYEHYLKLPWSVFGRYLFESRHITNRE